MRVCLFLCVVYDVIGVCVPCKRDLCVSFVLCLACMRASQRVPPRVVCAAGNVALDV